MNRRTLFRLTLGALVAPFLPTPVFPPTGHSKYIRGDSTWAFFSGDGVELGRIVKRAWEDEVHVAASVSERPVNRG